MDWAWVAQLEAFWHSPAFPMWAALTAAAFFGIVLLITLLRADRSVANGALAIITLLAIGVAAAATVRGNAAASGGGEQSVAVVGQGALACLDGLAGDKVESACEKALFASADATAAAVSYTAAQITRLPIAANQATPELAMLRRVLERDRYGLAAQVLTTREGCTPAACDAFRYLVNSSQIASNMSGRAFETLVARHEDNWASGTPMMPVVGRPAANIDYPTAASIPPVSIMTAEPPRSEPATQAAAPAGPAPVIAPHMAVPPNSLPFPSSNAAAPPAKRGAPPSAPPKRAAGPGPVSLVPQ